MRRFFNILAALSLLAGSIEAVLPPVWEGIAEIKAIANAPKLKDYLDSAEILESITKTEEGWVIKTSKSEVFVKVLYLPQEMPGPSRFELKFTKAPLK